MSDTRIPLSEPALLGNEGAYLQECVQTGFVSSVGAFVDRFEKAFAARVGAPHAVACASGTAALHLALRVLDLEPGDEVFVSSLTFIASANPILYERATPVLVDSELRTWNLDPALVCEELDRRARLGLKQPKAIIAVHLLGHPIELRELVQACERHGVVLIEDAAEALGARYEGREVGTFGRLGCFSFNGNKIVTAGGGGMVVTADAKLAARVKHLSTQAKLAAVDYRHDEVGYNYRLTNIAAAVGLAQLEQLDTFLQAKRTIAERYDRAFNGLTLPPRLHESSYWLYSIELPNREAVRTRLASHQIEARPIWTPLHLIPFLAAAPRLGSGKIAEGLHARALSLPSSVRLTEAEQNRVIEAVLT
jgi:dTDP-4-amino-4,6-dideoxygalactose transaminase